MAEYTPSTSDIRYWLTGPDYEGGPVAEVVGRDFDRWLAAHDHAVKAEAVRELGAEWDREYEALTARHGAYGQMKIRAAYRLASVLASKKADQIEGATDSHGTA